MIGTYFRHTPSPPLNAYIDYLYYDASRVYRREKMLPMATQHLIFNLGAPIGAYDGILSQQLATCTDAWVIGAWSISHIAKWPLHRQFYGVAFKPGRAYPFLQRPLAELHNRFVSLDALWGPFVGEVRERLHAAPTPQAGFAVLERMLLIRLGAAPRGLQTVQAALTHIERQHGALSIAALSEHLGVSHNNLGRQFKQMVGLSPKELARLYRLTHALRAIDPLQPVDWLQIAAQCGYYDQAHFCNDLKAFVGHSPTEYLLLSRQFHAADPDRARLLRTLPVVEFIQDSPAAFA